MRLRSTLLTLLALLNACTGSSDGDQPASVHRDSLGVSIIESTGPSGHWEVEPSPLLDLGLRVSDPYVFGGIQALGRLSSGSIVVIDNASPFVRLFSFAGDFLGSTGISGDGPGEFRRPASVGILPNDSLAVYDAGSRRLTILTADLDLADTRQISDEGGRPGYSLNQIGDTLFVENAAMSSGDLLPLGTGLHRPQRSIRLIGPSGEIHGALEGVPIGDVSLRDGRIGSPLFGKFTLLDGFEGQVVLGFAEAMEIERRTPSGRVTQIPRILDGVDRTVSDSDISREVERYLEVLGTSGDRSLDATRQEMLRRPRMDTKPAYSHLLVDTEGYVWLGEYASNPFLVPPSPPEAWHVIAPDGLWATTLKLPPRFLPYWIDSEIVLGVARDQLDVETVVAYRLTRGDG
jgi:hypothetical protein